MLLILIGVLIVFKIIGLIGIDLTYITNGITTDLTILEEEDPM